MPRPNIERAFLALAALFPMVAYASFGGTSCKDDFVCYFLTLGVVVGTVGVPISGLIFAVLHLGFCSRARAKLNQFFVGAFVGMAAYEISAVCASLIAALVWAAPGQNPDYPVIGFVAAYVASAIGSALYARSSPDDHVEPAGP